MINGSIPSRHLPVGAEARGKLRAWKTLADARFARAEAHYGTPPMQAAVKALVLKYSVKGRARAFDKIRRMINHGRLEKLCATGSAPHAIWVTLKPRIGLRANPETPGEKQDVVVAEYVIAGVTHFGIGTYAGFWSIEVTEHALGRLLQRNRRADIDAVLYEAHRAAMNIRCRDVKPRFAKAMDEAAIRAHSFLLPAGSGVFVCTFDASADESQDGAQMGAVRATTWLAHDMLSAEQDATILDVSGDHQQRGERLGDRILVPPPLQVEPIDFRDYYRPKELTR
jgi:hypothetical protein